MLPQSRRSFAGYRLILEYFCFPQKFFFLDLVGLDKLRLAGFGDRAEVVFLISPFERGERREMLETGITAKTFLTDCVPVVNLFSHTAEPILLEQTRYDYQVVPDVSRRTATEIFSIDDVVSVDPKSDQIFQFEPFYSFRHAAPRDRNQAFWYSVRRPSGRRGDEGTEVFISLVDLSGRPFRPSAEALTVRTWCTNRDLPSRLPFGNESGDFELEGAAPIKRIVALIKPTDTLRPPLQKHGLWRLISALSLNYLSLVEGGAEALQEILRLYNFTGSAYSEKQIQGLATAYQQAALRAGDFGKRGGVRARNPGGNRLQRRALRRRRRLPVCVGAGIFSGVVREHEQLQPVSGAFAPEKGGVETMATARRTESSAVVYSETWRAVCIASRIVSTSSRPFACWSGWRRNGSRWAGSSSRRWKWRVSARIRRSRSRPARSSR